MATLNLNKAEFLKSAVSPSGFLAADLPCIVFAGKSNVGKSSVINRLLNRKNFAQVRMKGTRRTRNFIRGASNTKSSMFFTMVDIKMVRPLESTISRGNKSRMEK